MKFLFSHQSSLHHEANLTNLAEPEKVAQIVGEFGDIVTPSIIMFG